MPVNQKLYPEANGQITSNEFRKNYSIGVLHFVQPATGAGSLSRPHRMLQVGSFSSLTGNQRQQCLCGWAFSQLSLRSVPRFTTNGQSA